MSDHGDGRVRAASVDELGDGDRTLVHVDGTSVGVFNLDGEYYALANECPHQGGPVCTGRIGGKIVAEERGVGERVEERVSEERVVACPWHGWEYDVETGEHVGNPRVALETYDVVVDGEDVFVVP